MKPQRVLDTVTTAIKHAREDERGMIVLYLRSLGAHLLAKQIAEGNHLSVDPSE